MSERALAALGPRGPSAAVREDWLSWRGELALRGLDAALPSTRALTDLLLEHIHDDYLDEWRARVRNG